MRTPARRSDSGARSARARCPGVVQHHLLRRFLVGLARQRLGDVPGLARQGADDSGHQRQVIDEYGQRGAHGILRARRVRLDSGRAAARCRGGRRGRTRGRPVIRPDRNHVPLCPLHALTGIWCPFCGGLRVGLRIDQVAWPPCTTTWWSSRLLRSSLAFWIDAIVRARAGKTAPACRASTRDRR